MIKGYHIHLKHLKSRNKKYQEFLKDKSYKDGEYIRKYIEENNVEIRELELLIEKDKK
jgi:hypothetical protein